MNIEDERWDAYEAKFRALAERAALVDKKLPRPALDRSRFYLCLYGENGLPPEEELQYLDRMSAEPDENLKRIEVDTAYWQDTVLFIP